MPNQGNFQLIMVFTGEKIARTDVGFHSKSKGANSKMSLLAVLQQNIYLPFD